MLRKQSRILAALLAAVLLAAILSACSSKQTETPKDQTPAAAKKVTLTFWNGFTGPDRPALEGIVKKWNDANPNVQIAMEIMPWDSLFQKLMPALTTGSGPDLIAFDSTNIPQFAKAGVIAPLDDLYGANGLDPAIFPKAALDTYKYGGKMYGAPMNFATLLMYYNKDLLKAAGLPERAPANWDEMAEWVVKLTKPGAGGTPDQYGMSIAARETIPVWPILFWAGGGDFVANGKSTVNTPENLSTLKLWGGLIRDKKVSATGLTGATADKLFETKKAALTVTGPWMTSGFTAAGLNYDVAPIPAGPKGQFTLGTSVSYVVNAKIGDKKSAAYEFIKFWNSKDSQIAWALGSGFPPNRTDLTNAPELAKNPFIGRFAAVANQSRFYLPGLTTFSEIDTTALAPMIESVLYGKATPEDALKTADKQISDLLKKE